MSAKQNRIVQFDYARRGGRRPRRGDSDDRPNASPNVRGPFLAGSGSGHAALVGTTPALCTIRTGADEQRWFGTVKTMPKGNAEAGDDEIVVEAARPAPDPERSHVRLVAGDPPMLRLEINL